MFLNSEVIAALETAKVKIAEHTRQAALDLNSANDQLIAAMHLRHERKLSIAVRRAALDEEEAQVEAQFAADMSDISAQVLTIKRGIRDDDGTGGATVAQIPARKAG